MENIIEVKNLVKQFKKPIRQPGLWGMLKTVFSTKYDIKTAVDSVNFSIKKGEIIGYIGSNGAGKSTTIKMMCGILTPTSGSVTIEGLEPYKQRKKVAMNIGVVFGQKTQLWWDLPLIESFRVLKEVYLVPDDVYNERIKFLDGILGFSEFINQPVRTLSLGQRMRADLAASLIHNPKVLFLDEPTIGLDVLVKEKIRNAIKELNRKYGTTVILTTHDMSDIQDLCSRIIILDNGKIIYDGDLENVRTRFGDYRTVTIECLDKAPHIEQLNTYDGKITYTSEDNFVTATYDARCVNFEQVINDLVVHLHIKDMKIKETSIEDVVKRIYTKDVEATENV